jgi:dipeptidase E
LNPKEEPVRTPTILALGGGGFLMEPENPLLDDHLLALTGVDNPRLALIPTGGGDSDGVIARFYDAFARKARCSHLPLFRRDRPVDLLLEQDAIFVSGGNTANLLAVWRLHGVDVVLREAWARGVVLGGVSAGSLCWFEAGVTDSFGKVLAPLRDGLGFLAGSHCPHYDGEPLRRPTYTALVASGALPPGLAVDDGAALCFRGTRLEEVVSSRPNALGWAVGPDGTEALPTRYLGAHGG